MLIKNVGPLAKLFLLSYTSELTPNKFFEVIRISYFVTRGDSVLASYMIMYMKGKIQ